MSASASRSSWAMRSSCRVSFSSSRAATERRSSRAVCTTVDRLRYSLHESLFDGSEGKSACGCRPGHAKGRDSSHAGGFSTHHKALSETQKGDGVGGTEASSQAYLLNRPERRA